MLLHIDVVILTDHFIWNKLVRDKVGIERNL